MKAKIIDKKIVLKGQTVCCGDKNAQTITIEAPLAVDGVNLTNLPVYVKTENALGQKCKTKLVSNVTEDCLLLEWKLGAEATLVSGKLKCQIVFEDASGELVMHTKIFTIEVQSSVSDNGPKAIPEYNQITQMQNELVKMLEQVPIKKGDAVSLLENDANYLTKEEAEELLDGGGGVGITKIEKTASEGLVDTYTINYSNGNSDTFNVTNGEKGEQGIQGEKGEQGIQGEKGEQGVGIKNITSGTATIRDGYTVTPITVTKTDNNTETFEVKAKNGADGSGGGSGTLPDNVAIYEGSASNESQIILSNGVGKEVKASGIKIVPSIYDANGTGTQIENAQWTNTNITNKNDEVPTSAAVNELFEAGYKYFVSPGFNKKTQFNIDEIMLGDADLFCNSVIKGSGVYITKSNSFDKPIDDEHIPTVLEVQNMVGDAKAFSSGNMIFATPTSSEYFTFELLDDNTYSVAFKGVPPKKNIVIPPFYNGKRVTKIVDYAFYNQVGIYSVIIPNTVTYIGKFAFDQCANLSSVIIPNSVVTIGDNAFNAFSKELLICCEAESKPEGWVERIGENWNGGCTVVWGYKPYVTFVLDSSAFMQEGQLVDDNHIPTVKVVDSMINGSEVASTVTKIVKGEKKIKQLRIGDEENDTVAGDIQYVANEDNTRSLILSAEHEASLKVEDRSGVQVIDRDVRIYVPEEDASIISITGGDVSIEGAFGGVGIKGANSELINLAQGNIVLSSQKNININSNGSGSTKFKGNVDFANANVTGLDISADAKAILDVATLPTENVNENVIYRVPTANFAHIVQGKLPIDQFLCNVVDTLPEVGNPAVVFDSSYNPTFIEGYYVGSENNAYGYVDNVLSQIGDSLVQAIPVGWYPLEVLFPIIDQSYGGIINSLDQATDLQSIYLLVEYGLFIYKNGRYSQPSVDTNADLTWGGSNVFDNVTTFRKNTFFNGDVDFTNANVTGLPSGGSSGLTKTKVTLAELQELITTENLGMMVSIYCKDNVYKYLNELFAPVLKVGYSNLSVNKPEIYNQLSSKVSASGGSTFYIYEYELRITNTSIAVTRYSTLINLTNGTATRSQEYLENYVTDANFDFYIYK